MKRQLKSLAQTLLGGIIGSILTVVIVLKADCSNKVFADNPYPFPSGTFPVTKQLDDTTWRKHDTEKHVTCYVYSFDTYTAANWHGSYGGISCLTDYDIETGIKMESRALP